SLRMPEKDGYWLIRRLRSMSADHGGRTPAIAFTGCTTKEDRLNALRAGFQSHVPKPADLRELARVVALWSLRREAVLAYRASVATPRTVLPPLSATPRARLP